MGSNEADEWIGAIILIGFVVLIAGIVIAFSNPITIGNRTYYPYSVAGGIVCLIGIITAIIGFAMSKNRRQDIQKPMKKKKKRIIDFLGEHIWTKEVI